MNAKARNLSVALVILATPSGIATVGLARANWLHQEKNINAAQETDGAYRDGFFLGKLDAQHGRKAQPGIARWNTDKDRASFKAGYEKGYTETLNPGNTQQRR